MTTIDTKHIQDTVDYLRKCMANQRAMQANYKESGNVALENWAEGRGDAFEDVARWIERDLKYFTNQADKAA